MSTPLGSDPTVAGMTPAQGSASPTATSAVRCEDLSKRYGEGEASVLAVDSVSLEFPHGQLTTDQSITPTPTLPSLTLTSPYPTTPYPPFPASLALPPSNAWPSAVAETPGHAFRPPQPPR